MGADEFRDYILGFIFYKYLSEKMHSYADELLKPDGMGYMSLKEGTAQGVQGNSNSRPHPHDDRAEGMLLYATVRENNYVHRFAMPPHRMTVATVDLNTPWQDVEHRLLDLILNQPVMIDCRN